MTGDGPRSFATTEWSVVLAAGARLDDSAAAREALERLCSRYWYPLYAFARRQGNDPERAADLTQAFFARAIETDLVAGVDRERGRFRAFLLACMRHFMANAYERERAQKRGGGKTPVSLDQGDAEARYQLEPSHSETPERLYDRSWALTLLGTVLARLRDQASADGSLPRFEALKHTLTASGEGDSYAEVADRLGTTEGAIKIAAHRLRARYRSELRAEIASTVETAAEIDAEIQSLFDALSRGV